MDGRPAEQDAEPVAPPGRRPRPAPPAGHRRRRAIGLLVFWTLVIAGAFFVGLVVGRAIEDAPRPGGSQTLVRTLEPSTVENGCLRVIPRSHAERRLHEHLHEDRTDLTLNQRMAHVEEDAAVDIELEPGQMSLHEVYMIHGGKPNTSGMRRTGAALRYMPSTSVFDRQLRPVDGKSGVPVDFARRPLWLVRGVDRSGRNDLRTGHGS